MPVPLARVPPMFDRRLTVALLMIGTAAAFGLVYDAYSRPALWIGSFPPWLVGWLAGLVLGLLYWHKFRGLGFVPPALTVSAAAGGWLAAGGPRWAEWVAVVPLGFAVARLALYLGLIRLGRWLAGVWLTVVAALVAGAAVGRSELVLGPGGWESKHIPYEWFAGLVAVLAVVAWVRLARPAFELALEPPFWLCYPTRTAGPGLAQFPATGPVLVIANHACWFDPGFLGKVLPRATTPMMTSKFYDLPGLNFLMARILKPIRVQELARKTGTPAEIGEAIAALDRGQCVVVFPEGYLRRSDTVPLRRFGRGVWQILTARPDTPVFACWIEGGWGSFTSYFNGKPARNKRFDFRRRIGVGVDGPFTVGPETLAHHMTTRVELMNRVAAARMLLGLPELPLYDLPRAGEREEGEKGGPADDADSGAE